MRILTFIFIFIVFNLFGQNDLQIKSKINLDNENQIIFKSYQGYSHTFDSLKIKDSTENLFNVNTGLFNSFVLYQDTSISKKFNEVRTSLEVHFDKGTKVYFSPAILISNNWSPFIYDFNTFIPFKKFNLEINSERDLVGPRAIKKSIVSQYNGISLDYSPIKKLTIVGSIQKNNITDGNIRYFYISRVIYSPSWYFIDARTRNMRGGKWSEFYFSPETIDQWNIGTGFTKRFFSDRTRIKSYFGVGYQRVDKQSMSLIIIDLNLSNKFSKKIEGETSIGLRNIGKYFFTFGEFRLKYILDRK